MKSSNKIKVFLICVTFMIIQHHYTINVNKRVNLKK